MRKLRDRRIGGALSAGIVLVLMSLVVPISASLPLGAAPNPAPQAQVRRSLLMCVLYYVTYPITDAT